MLPTIEDVYARAEMIIKVKEPIAPEYKLIRKDQLVWKPRPSCLHSFLKRVRKKKTFLSR